MEKMIALFNAVHGDFDGIALVKGYDTDEKFQKVLDDARAEWWDKEATDREFFGILQRRASKAGYEVSFPNFTRFNA